MVGAAALTGALVLGAAPHATADQVRDGQWALKTLHAESLWKTTRGKGQTVAVIDGGVNADHPDLEGNVLPGKDFMDGGSAAPEDGDDHGTGMSGIIAAHGHGPGNTDGAVGLAPDAKILPIRDLGERINGYADSIRYAVKHGASVINISQKQDYPLNQDAESEAIAYALKHNVVIVAGTGNDGGPVGYPAAYPGVVAASGLHEDGTFWENSNRGDGVMLSAPAVKIVSTGGPSNLNGYRIGDGTSDATAFVSASVALLKTKYPDLTAGQIVNRLTKTAELPASKKGAKRPDEQYGYGAIRPLAALQEDIPKGSAFGPLAVPPPLQHDTKTTEKSPPPQHPVDHTAPPIRLWVMTGILTMFLAGGLTLTLLLMGRRTPSRNPGSPGSPGATVPNQAGPPQQETQQQSPHH
ncbi:hypothetical protein AN218_09345 [Streptomyces nanshensis]|uniref:Peptidase S8/S53 domain-containing protein n=1 Tax=Streptomyces nanshensis TaxID=518642 RepID=A0A1E7L7M7_9ACTN|nr:hypothetical protein AN218_09345 [Streptomyces nanshensis]